MMQRCNIDVPRNVRIVCRNIDIYDPVSVKKCCIAKAQAVIVNPGNDIDTVKSLLAVSSVLGTDNHDGALVIRGGCYGIGGGSLVARLMGAGREEEAEDGGEDYDGEMVHCGYDY